MDESSAPASNVPANVPETFRVASRGARDAGTLEVAHRGAAEIVVRPTPAEG